MSWVSQEWIRDVAQSTLRSGHVAPGFFGILTSSRAAYDLSSNGLEFIMSIREFYDFSWADKSEIQWVKKEDDIFSFKVRKGDLAMFAVGDTGTRERWGHLAYDSSSCLAEE